MPEFVYMNEQDAPRSNQATCYVTIDGRRVAAIFAKNFEGKMNVSSKEVPVLGKMIKGRKMTGLEMKFSMTIYKVTDMFDELVETYKNTGYMPTFDIQVTNEDTISSMGRSTKIYKNCTIDGDVILSSFDVGGDFIEQKIEGYCGDFEMPEKYKDIKGM